MSTTPTDYYVSAYSGEEIDAAIAAMGSLSGVNVRADVAQDLTADQQAQARSNIGAASGLESADYPGCYYNVLTGGAVEWINPPMVLGTEYRTAERCLDKPVYKARAKIDELTVGNQTAVQTTMDSTCQLIDCKVIQIKTDGSRTTLPSFEDDGLSARWWMRASGELVVYASSLMSSGVSVIAEIAYTKTTD